MKNTIRIKIGNRFIGGGEPILVQSMTNTETKDIKSTVKQIKELEEAGCEIVRVTVPDIESAEALKKIKDEIKIPLVADIHFDYRLAIESIENGVDKLRINPGNIGDEENIKKVVIAAKERNIPIRIGVNGGSLEKSILKKYGSPTPEAMVESALYHISLLEKQLFNNIIISLKSSSVNSTIKAYRLMSEKVNYPLHLGVTEAGTFFQGTVKSAIGIGSLLADGIGDTIRVSLTENPVEEIKVANEILKVLGLKKSGIEIISCPTCGRTKVNLIELVKKVEKEFEKETKNIKLAIMGCAVNGPGEAKEADVGVACGCGEGLMFMKGLIIKKVKEDEILTELRKIIAEWQEEKNDI